MRAPDRLRAPFDMSCSSCTVVGLPPFRDAAVDWYYSTCLSPTWWRMLTLLICWLFLALFALPLMLTGCSTALKEACLLNLPREIFSSCEIPNEVGGLRIGTYSDYLITLVDDADLYFPMTGFSFLTEFSLCLFRVTFFTSLRCLMSGDLLEAVM